MGAIKEAIILNLILPLADIKFKTSFARWYRKIKKMELWKPEKVKAWQVENMKKRIEHAYVHIPYYHELFDKLGLKPDDFNSMDDLRKIPVLTKEIIRENFERLIPDDVDKYPYHVGQTGGSTGNPLNYYTDNNSWGFSSAYTTYCWRQTGYRYGDKFVGLGGSSVGIHRNKSFVHKLFYKMKGKIGLASDNLNDDELRRYVDIIQSGNIHYIYGYASSMYLLAKYVLEKGLTEKLDIKAAYPTSDILTEHYADTIKKAFRCEIIDGYGAHDSCVGGFKRIGERGFKANYATYIETDNSIASGYGNIICTDLIGYSFPFIRYTLGDVVELDEESSYSAYFNGQVIKTVLGRSSEIVKLKNGFFISGISLTNVFKDMDIKGYKVDVESDSIIRIKIVPNPGFTTQAEQELIDAMKERTGNDYKIIVDRVKDLEKRANGKSLYLMVDHKLSTPPRH